jgi:hypothetical protein
MKLLHVLGFCLATLSANFAPAAESANPASSAPAFFQVRNKKFGDLLRPEGANSANGTRLVLYPAQPWKCMTWKFHSAGESAFRLQNYFTSKTFSAEIRTDGANAPVKQVPFAKDSAETPVWQFTKLQDGSYKITDAKSGKVLTALREEGNVRIVVQAWREGDEQKWELISIDPKQLTM